MHACTHSFSRDVKLLNTLSGSSEMLLLSRDLCCEWRGLCETIDQLIIVLCRSRRFQLTIWPHHVIVQYVMQCIVSCMHFQPFERHHGFEGTIMDCQNMIRKKAVRGPRELVSSSDVFHYLDLECNHHTQYLLAMSIFSLIKWLDPSWICSSTLKVNLQDTSFPAERRFHFTPPPFLLWV